MNKTRNLTWLAAIPAGWRPILSDAIERLHALDPSIAIVQAKEKFGSLRIHLRDAGPDANAIVDAATAASTSTCELCGAVGQLMRTREGYYSTRCDAHATDFFPVHEKPTVTFRVVGDDSANDPAVDKRDGNTSRAGRS